MINLEFEDEAYGVTQHVDIWPSGTDAMWIQASLVDGRDGQPIEREFVLLHLSKIHAGTLAEALKQMGAI